MFFSKKDKSIKENEFVKKSFSQTGEDLIVKFILEYQLGLKNVYYLDIGAYHPFYLSNTAIFDQNGCSGVCIEPNPILSKVIQEAREKCKVFNVGVGQENIESDFYVISPNTLSTFSKSDADKYALFPHVKVEKVIKIPIVSVNDIISNYCECVPNFVSIDVEGLDLCILHSLDFEKYRPEVFCVETLEYTTDKNPLKNTDIINFMISNGYFVYADTFINTIFVESSIWNNRKVAE